MPYAKGSPIDAYCTNCSSDTPHIVLEVAGIQVRAVRCERCGTDDVYRTPRAKARAALMQLANRKTKPVVLRKRASSRSKETPEQAFRRLMSGRDAGAARPYNAKTQLGVGDLVRHPSFGVGLVVELTAPQKAKIAFEDGEKVLVCNRG